MLREAVRMLAPSSRIGYKLPDPEFFWSASNSNRYTPDIAQLEAHEWQLYFACDETQRGHLKHDLIGEHEDKCPGFTQKSFNYWDHDAPFMPPIPMAANGFHNSLPGYPDICKIKGRILKIRPQAFLKLDEYKENGVQFRREKVRILVPWRQLEFIKDPYRPPEWIEQVLSLQTGLTYEKVHVIRAWMYVGVPQYWDKMISVFDYRSVQTFEAKNRQWCHQYYQYRKPVPAK